MSMAAAERDRALKLLREANAEIERLKAELDTANAVSGYHVGMQYKTSELNAEIERLKAENAELRREIGGFPHLSDMRQCMLDVADENVRLKKVADQAIERADLRLAKDSDAGYCELNQRLPVWSCFHSDLHAYLKEKEKQG